MFGPISQLAHVEIQSPKPEDSARFFVEVLGMTETDRRGNSIYFKGWGDHFHHSLVVTEGPGPALLHVGWRSAGPEQLQAAVSVVETAGAGVGWVDATLGHGPAYRYTSPGGHTHEIFWEVDRYVAPASQRSVFPNRGQRFAPVGVAARQIDHVTIATTVMNDDIAFYRDVLGSRLMEYTVMNPGDDTPFFAQLSNNEQAHDFGMLADNSGRLGRSHHIAFWLDLPSDVVRAADVLTEAGVQVEYGPGRHGHGENTYLYFREPGGHRVELFSGGYRNYEPDWEPARWVAGEGGIDMFRNWKAPDSMLAMFPDPEIAAILTPDNSNPWLVVGVS